MNTWRGIMDWPMDTSWECSTCNSKPIVIDGIGFLDGVLTWGIAHATCRCNKCHTQYRMRNTDGNVVTTPILQLKLEYQEAAKLAWEKYETPIDEITKEMWDEFVEA